MRRVGWAVCCVIVVLCAVRSPVFGQNQPEAQANDIQNEELQYHSEHREIREERERLRAEHDELMAERDQIKTACEGGKGPELSTCSEREQILHLKVEDFHKRFREHNERVAEAWREVEEARREANEERHKTHSAEAGGSASSSGFSVPPGAAALR